LSLALLIVTVVLAHCAYGGTRLNLSLTALSSGASPLTVGVLMSLIAALPMLLGVSSGQLIDRTGVRVPMIAGVAILIAAVALPGLVPGVPSLLVSAAGLGSGFMLFQICAQHMVGEMSTDEDRRDNFGWLALGFATSNFVGPTVAGLTIDHYGHDTTFLVLAGFAAASLVMLVARRASLDGARPTVAVGALFTTVTGSDVTAGLVAEPSSTVARTRTRSPRPPLPVAARSSVAPVAPAMSLPFSVHW